MVCVTQPYLPSLGYQYVAAVNRFTHRGSSVLHMNVFQAVLCEHDSSRVPHTTCESDAVSYV